MSINAEYSLFNAVLKRLKNLAASWITSGRFGMNRMPDMALNKIMVGQGAASDPVEEDKTAVAGGLALYGDGSDGDVTIAADTTPTRDMFYNNLTINATKVLTPYNGRLFVKGTLINNGIISANGIDAVGGSGGGSVGMGSAGADGKETDLGQDGDNSDATTATQLGGSGGDGGDNGAFSGGNGGGGAAAPATLARSVAVHVDKVRYWGAGRGGGSGASDGGGGGGAERTGAGGGGAGFTYIFARHIVNNGTIRANGGKGSASTSTGDSGGGGGGGGGPIVMVYQTATWGTEVANGGIGGAGTGTGDAGQNGGDGVIIKIADA